ncbi:MAG TPA: MFS transporter [Ktedonosporobacter sp.]|nr:MFS transporter [Ktedonosporobacter sp.]
MPSKPFSGQNSIYVRLLRNRSFTLVWSGQTISTLGDTFFNLAVMWVIYAQSGSALQTALISVIWHISSIVFGPFAGAVADRWDRKYIMVMTNAVSALVVGIVAAVILARGMAAPALIFVTVFLINTLNTFLSPARFSIMPEIVGLDLMATASGLSSSAGQVASLIGSALAGIVIFIVGAAWAVAIDAFSFACAAICIAIAHLPLKQPISPDDGSRSSFWQEILSLFPTIGEGWKTIAKKPLLRAVMLIAILINVATFMGPLIPALVRQRLHGGAEVYGLLEAGSVVGAILGGVLAGLIERRIGAGRLLIIGWALSGLCTIGVAFSTSVPFTVLLEFGSSLCMLLGTISVEASLPALVPEEYRGRLFGTIGALAVLLIPLSALLGGWLTDLLGVVPLFAFGGIWVLAVATLALANQHIRAVRLGD